MNESEMEGEFEESGEEEEDINDYQDSPEEQNSNLQVSLLAMYKVFVIDLRLFARYTITGM